LQADYLIIFIITWVQQAVNPIFEKSFKNFKIIFGFEGDVGYRLYNTGLKTFHSK